MSKEAIWKIIEHLVYAIVFTLLFGYFIGWYHAALIAAVYCVAREHTQAEQRYIQTYCGNQRENAQWWCGLVPRVWNKDSFLYDMMLPVIFAAIVGLITGFK